MRVGVDIGATKIEFIVLDKKIKLYLKGYQLPKVIKSYFRHKIKYSQS